MHTKNYIRCIMLLLSVYLTACKKFVSIPSPQTQLETSALFENNQAAIAAVVGLYSQMMQTSVSLTNGGATVYPALSADELYNTSSSTDYDAFRSNEIQFASSLGLTRLWTFGFRNIYHINAVLEGLQASVSVTDSLKKQLRGEMLVTRALNYFYLVNLFGDLPLIQTTDFTLNQSLPRSASGKIYDLILSDLKEARDLLPVTYPAGSKTRPNKFTASALLARTYLYLQNWPLAEQYASEVISSNLYTLNPSLSNTFLAASPEPIWQISPVSSTINTAEGNTLIPSSATAKPALAITAWLLNAFETGDLRKTGWLKTNTVAGLPYTYPFKYKVRTAAPPYSEYYVIIRLAEMYFIRAEARVQQNDLANAVTDINSIRNRAGLANTVYNTQSSLLAAVMQERRIELMFEWGHRWLDLKRTSAAGTVLLPLKSPGWQSTDIFYPVLQYELDTNPFLIQTPGY
ncbi:MAG: RagB/SusD family nutrient uptake outer membrane protein [Chitinophagaceae bacterium]|nr:RagB/SusD family nutrient uptake outer membrane protein [Chitinophagaceae bacterium]